MLEFQDRIYDLDCRSRNVERGNVELFGVQRLR